MTFTHHYNSPLGLITMASDGENLTGLWFDGQKYFGSTLDSAQKPKELPVFAQTEQWLTIYLDRKSVV